jgi:hypothetical protein
MVHRKGISDPHKGTWIIFISIAGTARSLYPRGILITVLFFHHYACLFVIIKKLLRLVDAFQIPVKMTGNHFLLQQGC